MNKPAAKRKGSPIIFVQIGVVLLVAAAIAAGIYVQSQSVDEPAPLPTTATPALPPASQSRLVFNLNNTSFSNAVELGGSVQLGLLDTNGITSTLNLSMPIGVPYELQDHYLVSFSSSPAGTLRVFTATYTVRDIVSADLRQFSTAMTATNALGDAYSFSQPLVAPDGNSIAFIVSHQEFIDNGTQVRLTWTLLRVDLNSDAETTLGSGQLTSVNAPAVGLFFWSSASNQIYLTQQQGVAQNPSSVTLYPYKTDGSGGGLPVTIPSVFSQPSPDGSKLAYLDNDVATFDPQQPANFNRIVILDFYSGGLRRISAATGNRIEPDIAWSPDSQRLAYIERLGSLAVGGTPGSSLFYHILLKRLDPGAAQPTTISEYQAGANVAPDTTNSNMAWCGDYLYIQLVSFIGQGQTRAALYDTSGDGQGGFHRVANGEWPYQMLGCGP